MRINRLTLRNFKKYEDKTFTFHPQFTLLVGDNGAGKTSILDGLAVALGVWLIKTPDTLLNNSRRNILETEIRLVAEQTGDRTQFRQKKPVVVEAFGTIGDMRDLTWTREITETGKITNNSKANQALAAIEKIYRDDEKGLNVLCPVIAYYGAGRAWLSSNERVAAKAKSDTSRRWSAFYDCFNERIRFAELNDWFRREFIASANRNGRMRPGFEAVQKAVLRCIPGSEKLRYDSDLQKDGEIVLTIDGTEQPFSNLSSGQKMMLALVADIAIKAVTQNAYLLPSDELGPEDEPWPRLLRETPGVVLIDELDVHLHPIWQRQIVEDLRAAFPSIQFIATSHSPFVIQSLRSGEEIIVLDGQSTPNISNLGLEDIARGVMQVARPETSRRYENMRASARTYFELLEEAQGSSGEKLEEFKIRLSEASGPYADNPAFQAFLEMKRAGKLRE